MSAGGIRLADSLSGPQIYSSIITGTAAAVDWSGSTTTRITDTLLDGALSGDAGGTTNCRNTYDAALADVSC